MVKLKAGDQIIDFMVDAGAKMPPMRWQDDALKYNQDIINTTRKSLLS